ncbi:MAG: CRISPR-associated protein Cas4 [Chloroflexi bacterium]|jgi:CRISPR-associated exonuclease Cas4|nr:CRISPR-associated protein Cas4 [Chloroflexota bacterium]MBT3669209.1 CRISPR-associated protein Cas4 [Chloroflexota bacterium]MBT4003050.1 CRISPR-associated protein Cas4 [Chloroflexota bacterium]MBT4306454.1 CRISPR-associated protein Cas4 [Chloroflexota bacterium]MBT4534953.1 CRISPR-associated protein Cas4 [Chloroflexota bacterium]
MQLLLSILLLILAVFFLLRSVTLQKESGLPAGKVIYTDTKEWGASDEVLYDPSLGLSGKPDYLIRKDEEIIPVEVKTGRVPNAPYDSHIFQLAAYCYLVEKTIGMRPPHGIIHYGKRSFTVAYTKKLESALLDLVGEIRISDRKKSLNRSHDQARRCAGCGFSGICDQKI